MYACVCHAVTEDQIREYAEHGLKHVVRSTRAGSGCGSCVNRLRGLCAESPTPPTRPAARRELADSTA